MERRNSGGTIIGVFNNVQDAERAIAALRKDGFDDSRIKMSNRGGGTATGARTASTTGKSEGFMDQLRDFFSGDRAEDEHKWYSEREGTSGNVLVTVQCDTDSCDRARMIMLRHGASDYNTRAMGTEDRQRAITLLEDRLKVRRERSQTGEVRINKEVRETVQSIDVPVQREEVQIRSREVDRPVSEGDRQAFGRGETIRIPLYEEEVTVEREPHVYREIEVGKETTTETRREQHTVRREVPNIEREGHTNVRDESGDTDVQPRSASTRRDTGDATDRESRGGETRRDEPPGTGRRTR